MDWMSMPPRLIEDRSVDQILGQPLVTEIGLPTLCRSDRGRRFFSAKMNKKTKFLLAWPEKGAPLEVALCVMSHGMIQ